MEKAPANKWSSSLLRLLISLHPAPIKGQLKGQSARRTQVSLCSVVFTGGLARPYGAWVARWCCKALWTWFWSYYSLSGNSRIMNPSNRVKEKKTHNSEKKNNQHLSSGQEQLPGWRRVKYPTTGRLVWPFQSLNLIYWNWINNWSQIGQLRNIIA